MHTVRTAPLPAGMLPAFLGVFVAVLLGGTGFGLGCLYAEIAGPPPAMLVAANPGSAHPAASLRAPPPVVTDGMGGPDEAAPPMTAARPVSLSNVPAAPGPSSYAPGQLGRTLAMARPVWGGWISSHYGQRTDPFTGRPAIHRGLDFAGLDNSAILAVAPGVVTWSGRQRGYGNLIEIDHGHGWITRYGHNAANLVAVGDYVKPGQTIALMGSTGRATGTHLHFEVLYRGRHQNPARFVPQDA